MTIEAIDLPVFVIDFEATDATTDAQATEIGYCAVAFSAKGVLNPLHHPQAMLCKPDRPISYGAMAVTGICPEDIADKPPHTQVVSYYMPVGAAYIIAHNADYDIQVAKNAGVDTSQYKAICTLAIARKLHPETDHKLGALLYRFLYDEARKYAREAHSAAMDVRFCIQLLRLFCDQAGITDMQSLYEFSEAARIPEVMPMGKYKGDSISEIAATVDGRAYFFWMITDIDDNPYLIKAVQAVLVGSRLKCTVGSKYFNKGQDHTIEHFTDRQTLKLRDVKELISITLYKKAIIATIATASDGETTTFKVI